LEAGDPSPGPVLAPRTEALLHGVVLDVGERLLQVLLVANEMDRIPLAEDVTGVGVASVVPIGIATVEPMHQRAELSTRSFHQEVVVGVHQAIREHSDPDSGRVVVHQPEKAFSVMVVDEQSEAEHRSRRDVVDAIR
jgi:hypothetical protein